MHALSLRLKELLFHKKADEPLSKEDEKAWNDWVASEQPVHRSFHPDEPVVVAAFREFAGIQREKQRVWAALEERILQYSGGSSAIRLPGGVQRLYRWGLRTAMAAVIIVSAYLLIQLFSNDDSATDTAAVVPGTSRASIVLSDGRTLPIDEIAGPIRDAGVTISIDSNLIVYKYANIPPGSEVLYNEVITPRGGEHRVRLPDGTEVWLNAESSLRFPTIFTGHYRDVAITAGEAYFEIAHDSLQPFRVLAAGTVITSLGTQFNVSTYNKREGVRTTLVEGKIEVLAGEDRRIVLPGEQVLSTKDSIHPAVAVNTDDVLAWTEGFINLEGETLQTIMQQVSRWYDVEVVYDSAVDKALRGWRGRQGKSKPINDLLDALRNLPMGLDYRLDGRTVFVEPKAPKGLSAPHADQIGE